MSSENGNNISSGSGDAGVMINQASAAGYTNGAPPEGDQYSADYLAQLLKDKKQLGAFPNVFSHLERLVDDG